MALHWVRAGAGRSAKSGNQPSDRSDAGGQSSPDDGELKQVTSEYEALLERCGAAVVVLDAAGVVLRCNSEARQTLGLRGTPLEGLTLLAATLSDELEDLFRAARMEREVQRGEVRAPAATGNVLEVEISPVEVPANQTPRYLLVATDVTGRRRLETMRRDFVANVSHELRTPLASIRAMAETLQDGALNDPEVSSRFLGTIIAETDRLARIAEDLLVLSDAESQAPHKARVDVSDLAAQVVNRLMPQAEKADLTLVSAIEPDLVASANPDQLEQVLVNLIDNAVKYTGPGGSVMVRALRKEVGLVLQVSDTGIGIMHADLPRIFERFYRVDRARSRQSGGTGLGLSIVKHIVESHGGAVCVESEYNRGSTFTVTMPIAAGAPVLTGENDEPYAHPTGD